MPHDYPSLHVIAVLGIHRSGTSCFTGLLERTDVFLGEDLLLTGYCPSMLNRVKCFLAEATPGL